MIRKFILLAIIACNGILRSQTPAVGVPITLTDSSKAVIVLTFGLDPAASDTLDKSLGEQPLPPLPPAGAFDARFLLPNSFDASLKDFRQGSAKFDGTKVYEIQYQLGTGPKCTLSWAFPAGVTAELQDEVLGTIVDVHMTGSGSYTVSNTAITKLKLTVTYALSTIETIPTVPTLLSPAQGAINAPLNQKLTWSASAGAKQYTVQVSLNSAFSSFVINDTAVTDTTKQLSGLLNNTVYYWRVKAANTAGSSAFSATFSFTSILTSIQHTANRIPDKFILNQNYPNPFNPSTILSYSLAADSRVVIAVYDVLGHVVSTLVNADKAAGTYQISFNGSNLSGGMYFARIEAKNGSRSFVQVRKMILLK